MGNFSERIIEIKILTGGYAGRIVEAHVGRVTPINPTAGQWDQMVEGVQIPSLGNLELERYNPHGAYHSNYENLYTAFDINFKRINIGDRIVYCVGKEPQCGVVEKFGPICYSLYSTTRKLKIRNNLSKRLETVNDPSKCVVGHIVFTP